MTADERRTPRIIDPSRRNRIARGSGTQTQEVSALVKQFEVVAPLMKAMASKGIAGRMQALQELQRSGMLDPSQGGQMAKMKKGTGKRLTNEERARMRKQREKEMRRRRRG
jgi:signal recognition particle subunit SRP54